MAKLERELVKQGQSTIANEVTQLAQRGVGTVGVEFRCNADFVERRMVEGLQRLIAQVRKRPLPPLYAHFCTVAPTQIDLGLPPARRKEIDFYGYNLDAPDISVTVSDDNGETPVDAKFIAKPTHYLMMINIYSDTNALKFSETAHQMIFRLGKGGDIQTVNIVTAPHARFTVRNSFQNVEGGGAGIGASFREECPAGTVATGLHGRSGGYVDQTGLLCSPLNSDGTIGPFVLTKGYGGGGGGPFIQACPPGRLLVGVYGASGSLVDRIGGQCNTSADVVGQSGTISTIGTWGGPGGGQFAATCPSRQVVTGIFGQSGPFLLSIGVICREIALQ